MATIADVMALVDCLPDIAGGLESSDDPKARDAAKQFLAVWKSRKERIGELHAIANGATARYPAGTAATRP